MRALRGKDMPCQQLHLNRALEHNKILCTYVPRKNRFFQADVRGRKKFFSNIILFYSIFYWKKGSMFFLGSGEGHFMVNKRKKN